MAPPAPLQIEFSLIRMTSHETKNTAAEHMESFYRPFAEVEASGEKFDGLVITGAPIEHLEFEDVTYWDELTRVFDWTQGHVHSTFGVCWGGMAMIHHFHGVRKHLLEAKAFGCVRHENLAPASPYLRGFSDDMVMPVSRWTELRREEIEAAGLPILIDADETGPALVEDPDHRALYIFNHLEYDSGTLKEEYDRDVAAGTPVEVPANYYPDDDPSQAPDAGGPLPDEDPQPESGSEPASQASSSVRTSFRLRSSTSKAISSISSAIADGTCTTGTVKANAIRPTKANMKLGRIRVI